MSERDDVVRWSANPDAPAGMRELVRRATAADAGPSTVQLASMRGRIAAQLAAGPPVTAALIGRAHDRRRPRRRSDRRRCRHVSRDAAGATARAGAVYHRRRSSRRSRPRSRHRRPRRCHASPVAPAATATTGTAAVARAARAARRQRTSRRPKRSLVVSSAGSISEVALLEQARAALRGGRAADALGLTAQHATLYADGALGEEREALAIEALVELSRRSDAAVRWAKFATAYPQSNYHARLQRLIDERAAP